MTSPFATPPHPVTGGKLSPFTVSVPDAEIQKLKTLLELLPIAAPNHANAAQHAGRFGVTRDWLASAVAHWADPTAFDWRAHEATINSVPHFKLDVADDYDASGSGKPYTIHFAALFSANPDALPILLMHGWPGSFAEFLPILLALQERYKDDPAALPYHLVVPSLTGFGFSSPPPVDVDMTTEDQARIMAKLMATLGFGKKGGAGGTGAGGYLVQGGDVGSIVGTAMAALYDDVRGAHLNMIMLREPPPGVDAAAIKYSERELEKMEDGKRFLETGSDYARIHGNKPSTVGLAVGSSPVALLAWIGEKMLAWSDPATQPSLDDILRNISIYWFSGCYPTSIWFYRNFVDRSRISEKITWKGIKGKPVGFSSFRREISLPPKAWLDATGVVSWYREHEQGGHFAALERPQVLWKDVEDFIRESF
ncbi:Epoxide hydrolase [Lasiodiplodia theobromae]|uniref:Epoxide hydrolase n=1 Tax=Lasiodiplodia theobromae TaxID=45133 RepID=UPI0015C3546D|nr:Epoxide hydrolase [Lasiodiplodia theobromae]KAF4541597.1 Epoxide hydrolase [Lasiodiplodia theobromae]